MTLGCPRELLFGYVVETKVVKYDENSYFKLFLDAHVPHDHLDEVQSLGQPGVEHDPGVSQEMTFGQCC